MHLGLGSLGLWVSGFRFQVSSAIDIGGGVKKVWQDDLGFLTISQCCFEHCAGPSIVWIPFFSFSNGQGLLLFVLRDF